MLLLALAACAPDYSPNTYSTAAVQQANKVDQGVIAGYREIAIKADGTVGTVTGGAAGGVLGAQAPEGGVVTALSAIGGTLIGGLIGNSVEHAAGDTKAFEYIVRKTNGDLISLAQKDQTPLAIGLKVLVIEGKQARIVADYSVPPEPVAPSAAAQTNTGSDNKSATKSAKTETPKTDTGGVAATPIPNDTPAPAQAAPPAAPPAVIVETPAPPLGGAGDQPPASQPVTPPASAPQTAATPAPDTTSAPAEEPQAPPADQDSAAPPAASTAAPAPGDGNPTP